MNKILFIANGMGLGNSVRVDSVIQQLKPTHIKIYVLTSSNGTSYFKSNKRILLLPSIFSFSHYSKNSGILNWFLLSVSFVIENILNSFLFLYHYIRIRPQLVVSDSIYLPSLVLLRHKWCVINNSDRIVKNSLFLKSNTKLYLVELADYFFHHFLCKKVFSPWFYSADSSPPFINVGLTVRSHEREVQIPLPRFETKWKVGVIYSGSGLSPNLEVDLIGNNDFWVYVAGKTAPNTTNITYLGKINDVVSLLKTVDFVICNGGFLSLAEVITLQKPAVVCPIEQHTEQWINASIFVELGGGEVASSTEIGHALNKIVSNRQNYFSKKKLNTQGSAEIANHLIQLLEKNDYQEK